MLKQTLKIAAVALSLSGLPHGAAADTLRVVIDRMERSVELFVRLPASDVGPILGGTVQPFANAAGRFDLGVFRETGTAEEGDAVLGKGLMQVNGVPVDLPAMSVMLHPSEDQLDFATPADGSMAMSICNVLQADTAPAIEDLMVYGGFLAYPIDGLGAFSLHLPNPETIKIELIEFVEGELRAERTITVSPGSVLSFAETRPPMDRTALFAALGAFLTTMCVAFLVLSRGSIGARQARTPMQ